MRTRETPRNGDVILLVDADADTRMMYAESLRYQALHVIAVATAGRALMLASKVDVIVTELLLPGFMDGLGLIERLKGDRGSSGTPLVVVTACAWERERVRAEHAGCDRFLPKPCLPDDLAREVRQLLATTADRSRSECSAVTPSTWMGRLRPGAAATESTRASASVGPA